MNAKVLHKANQDIKTILQDHYTQSINLKLNFQHNSKRYEAQWAISEFTPAVFNILQLSYTTNSPYNLLQTPKTLKEMLQTPKKGLENIQYRLQKTKCSKIRYMEEMDLMELHADARR